MLAIAITTVCWIPPLLGLGALVRSGGDPALRPALSGFLGLGVLALLGIAINFFLPLGPAVSSAAWALGLAAFLWRRRWLLSDASGRDALVVACVLAALVAFLPVPMYDTGLYHLQTVQWATRARLEPGLGNLHSRLAVNSAWFVVCAMVELPFAVQRSSLFVSFLPSAFGAAAAAVGLRRFLGGDGRISSAILAATLLPVGAWALGAGSQAPDHVVAIATFVVLGVIARSLERDGDVAAEARAAILLSTFCVAVKLTAVPLLAGASAAALLRWRALPRGWPSVTAGIAALALVPWTIRTVVLSGCLVMPAAFTRLPGLPWAMPRADVQGLSDWIASWARTPGAAPEQVLGTWAWLPGWTDRTWQNPLVRAAAALAAAGTAAWTAKARETVAAAAVPWATAAGGVALWFLLAPDPRFAIGYLLAVGAVPLAFAATRTRLASRRGVREAIAAVAVGLSVHLASCWGLRDVLLRDHTDVPLAAWPPLPLSRTTVRTTASGLVVRVPVEGDQCWNAPIPCAPTLDPRLAYDGGFVKRPAERGLRVTPAGP